MKFKELNISNELKHALSDLSFTDMLDVQEKTFEKIMDNKDLIVKSNTGSGKTLAFILPIAEKLDVRIKDVMCVVLVPTRELALQVKEEFDKILKYKELKTIALYGKEDMDIQRRKLKIPHQIIVSTPGRLMDHVNRKNIKLDNVKNLIIDEADEMLIMGFIKQIETIINKIPNNRNTLMFSATISEKTKQLANKYMRDYEEIIITSDIEPLDKIEQVYYKVPGNKKVDFLKKLLKREEPRKCIVFCNTREETISLYRFLNKHNNKVCLLHGGMTQNERFDVYRDFKKNKYDIMITTDVSSRGIHIHGVSHVINYYVPFELEQYVHRIGRTGRVDKNGIAMTLVSNRELERFEEIEEYIGYKIPLKGGYLDKKKKTDIKVKNKKQKRFKDDFSNKNRVLLEINLGRFNSKIRPKDISFAISSINGVTLSDVGKINILDKTSRVYILNGKEKIVLKALKDRKIKGYKFKVKKI